MADTIPIKIKVVPLKEPNADGQWSEFDVPRDWIFPLRKWGKLETLVNGRHGENFAIVSVQVVVGS